MPCYYFSAYLHARLKDRHNMEARAMRNLDELIAAAALPTTILRLY